MTIGSSLLDHHHYVIITSGSSLDLDHHQVWIIIIDAILEWCYLLILLVIGSSAEPALFHAGCRPTLHVGIQHLYLTLIQNGPPSSYI